jgi:FkbM family methyltransferase
LTRDHVVWAYRLLLDRDPESEDAIPPKLRGCPTTRHLRAELMNSAEFREKNPDYAHTNASTVVIKLFDDGVRLCVDLSDHVIGLPIVRGEYEHEALQFVRRTLRPGQHAVDVGAHIGFFAMHMAAIVGPSGTVTAFEPFARNADLLERSIAENRFEAIVALHRAAVAAAPGTARLAFARETLNTGGAFLVPGGAGAPGDLLTDAVPTVALDDVRLPRPVSFVKMDVEGAEPQVIAGARQVLAADRPIILSEVHVAQLASVSRVTPADFIAAVESLGYTCRSLSAEGPGDRVRIDSLPPVSTVVFVPVH